ncbi:MULTISPECIES: hypothetical protein [Moorena]|nr:MULTISPECIES: hypothetical protein [Moorena]NEP32900.1 hypothetical protein [Moorena sp. SIO3B2]NEP70342.1 hypothetical protein [Moorena sp. SIO3A5]NEQ08879.1 hypothetical protein [Moorena sp. SIO4E2]NER88195.1 hypothetical protein [Moorena sp. SIO3A2]NES43964.1 hypothetical protein [Moorena sp. SIO2C4]
MLKPIHPDGEGHPYHENDARYEPLWDARYEPLRDRIPSKPHDHQLDWGTELAITVLAPAQDIETLAVEDAL